MWHYLGGKRGAESPKGQDLQKELEELRGELKKLKEEKEAGETQRSQRKGPGKK